MIVTKNIIAFDFGIKNIGVAIGQCFTHTAQPLTILKVRNGVFDKQKISKLFNEWEPKIAVIGLPLNMNGTEQPITIKARNFAYKIRNLFNIYISLHDERLSTFEARTELFKYGGYRALKKKNIDEKSAVIILESWLNKFCKNIDYL